MTTRVLHLAGSAVSEFLADLSRLYAADCWTSASGVQRYEFHAAYVTPDRRWRFPSDLSAEAIAAVEPMSPAEAIARITAIAPDVVVPQMFCLPGMTAYRGLFDVLGIPYVGNKPEVMALGADKAKAKAVVAAAGVQVPHGDVVGRGDTPSVQLPVVVKPLDGDNSVGVTLVRTPDEIDAALAAAFEHSEQVLVESYIPLGREVRCGIVVRDGELLCLPLEEYNVDADAHPIRLQADKISGSGNDIGLVAKDASRAWIVDPADPITEKVWEAARRCHAAMGCRHYSLFDFRIDPDGEPWFLEGGLYCSFATTSVISVMARAAGITLDDLFAAAVDACRLPNR